MTDPFPAALRAIARRSPPNARAARRRAPAVTRNYHAAVFREWRRLGVFTRRGNASARAIAPRPSSRTRSEPLVPFQSSQSLGHSLGDRNITVREDKAPTKSAPSKSGGNRGSTLGDTPAAEGCCCYVGNLAWETTEDSLIGTFPRDARVERLARLPIFVFPPPERRGRSARRDRAAAPEIVLDRHRRSPRFFPRRRRNCHGGVRFGLLFRERRFSAFFIIRLPGSRAATRFRSRRPRMRDRRWTDTSLSFFTFKFLASNRTAHCSQVGTVVQSEVARQPGGRSKGWGLVDYESPEAATAACAAAQLRAPGPLHHRAPRARGRRQQVRRRQRRPPRGVLRPADCRSQPPWSTTSRISARCSSRLATSSRRTPCATPTPAAARAGAPCSSRPASRRRLRSRASTALSSSTAPCRSSSTATPSEDRVDRRSERI